MATESVQEKTEQGQVVEHRKISADNAVQILLRVVAGIVIAAGIVFWGIHSLGSQDPYVQSVLQIPGDTARGREIFKLNCAICHGLEASGEVGPDLRNVSERKSRVALIEQVISGQTPPMPQFQPGEKDMADLLSFLETL